MVGHAHVHAYPKEKKNIVNISIQLSKLTKELLSQIKNLASCFHPKHLIYLCIVGQTSLAYGLVSSSANMFLCEKVGHRSDLFPLALNQQASLLGYGLKLDVKGMITKGQSQVSDVC